ncbi:hypothetical protein GYH30_030746 [Glycine max]|nr:hypothetical protein GYH30_030746 [Glycine max]
MMTPKLQTVVSTAATVMLLRSLFRDYVSPELHHYLRCKLSKLFSSFSSEPSSSRSSTSSRQIPSSPPRSSTSNPTPPRTQNASAPRVPPSSWSATKKPPLFVFLAGDVIGVPEFH